MPPMRLRLIGGPQDGDIIVLTMNDGKTPRLQSPQTYAVDGTTYLQSGGQAAISHWLPSADSTGLIRTDSDGTLQYEWAVRPHERDARNAIARVHSKQSLSESTEA